MIKGISPNFEYDREIKILILLNPNFFLWQITNYVVMCPFLKSGCCTPPEECHMRYVNATFWEKDDTHETGPSVNADCNAWKNDRDVLCYDCQSCKQGYVKALKSKWSKLGVFLVSMAVFLMACHLALFLATMWEVHCT